jgi:protease I
MTDLKSLKNKSIAIMVTDGFEEIELTAPLEELQSYGAKVDIVADKPQIRSWKNKTWGDEFDTDRLLESFNSDDYDVLILPGGVINTDKLRRNKEAVEIVASFNKQGKLIAAICHGPQMLIEADLLRNKSVTGHFAIKKDIQNAGGNYGDYSVVKDENLITARGASDVSAFLKKIIGVLKVTNDSY